VGRLGPPGDPVDPTVPVGGLDRIDALLTGYRRSGLDIAVTVTGPARPVAGQADLTAYRVVQESLTNVCKHVGPTSVTIGLAYQPEALVVEVENRSPGQRPAGLLAGLAGGHGQVGMRERVEAVGGTFAAGPVAGGRYRVTARLPLAFPAAA
jgi:signal transduction histidine kinase